VRLEIGQLTDVWNCNLQDYLLCKRTAPAQTGPLRSPMNTRAPIRPSQLHSRRVRLTAGPAAAAEARSQVRAAIRAWDVPIDPDVALLLTSELVTNAIRHEAGEIITLFVTCCYGHLRVDVHDTSPFFPVRADASADDETGRGLMLVDSLSDKWGCDRTPAGKAVYFTLEFRPDLGRGRPTRPAVGVRTGAVSRERPAVTHPQGTRLRFTRRSPRCDGAQG
jgi:anti-sigma regulatory factor (Ser/Thr protein kinase)